LALRFSQLGPRLKSAGMVVLGAAFVLQALVWLPAPWGLRVVGGIWLALVFVAELEIGRMALSGTGPITLGRLSPGRLSPRRLSPRRLLMAGLGVCLVAVLGAVHPLTAALWVWLDLGPWAGSGQGALASWPALIVAWWGGLCIAAACLSDSLAYFGGCVLGGPKLWPKVSPSKTWSGSGVAFVGTMLFVVGALSLKVTLMGRLAGGPWTLRIWVGAALAVAAQAGDLAESALKRFFGVKDSGAILPGHGGILDRIDSWLAMGGVGAALALWLTPQAG
jgi:CDP-diglyceride synthetase